MKPQAIIKTLIKAISDPSFIRHGRERTIISLDNYDQDMTFILHSGTVAVHRSKDHLLLKFVESPMIVGMNDLFNANEGLFYQVCGEVKYEIRKKMIFWPSLMITISGKRRAIFICMVSNDLWRRIKHQRV